MSNFNGSWRTLSRTGDAEIMREFNVREDMIDTLVKEKMNPVYTFFIDENKTKIDFIQSWPKTHSFLQQSGNFGQDLYQDQSNEEYYDLQGEFGYSMVWNVESDNELSSVFSQVDENGNLGFKITTKYEVKGDLLIGETTSLGGAKASIVMERA